jgi:hypothetical protein
MSGWVKGGGPHWSDDFCSALIPDLPLHWAADAMRHNRKLTFVAALD